MICIVVCIEMWCKRVYEFSNTSLFVHYQQVTTNNCYKTSLVFTVVYKNIRYIYSIDKKKIISIVLS